MLMGAFSFSGVEAQIAPTNNGIFFQAVARDNYSNPAKDRTIYVEASIIQNAANGTKVLTELFQTNTDGLGVFSISIGSGTRIGGTLSGLDKVDWANGPYFLGLKIAIKPLSPVTNWDYTKELIDLGASAFGTVPYAFYAANSSGSVDQLKASDTTKMLLPYAKTTDLALKVNLADSSTIYVTPTQLKAVKFDTTSIYAVLNQKEILANKSINVTTDATSDVKYPSVRAVKTYVDLQFSNFVLADGSVTSAKIANGAVTDAKIVSVAGAKVTGDITGNAATATLAANATKLATPRTINGVAFDGTSNITIATGSNPIDADANTKGIVQLTGDLTGTAAQPLIATGAVTNAKISDVAATKITGTVAVANGGTGATTAAGVRTNLGLVIGTDVLAQRSFGSAANNNTTDFIAATDKGANNGVATLGNDGKIPSTQIPAISFQSASVIASQAAMLALANQQVGSIAIRTDNNKNYVLSTLPATTLANWIELATPSSVTSVNGNAGPNVVLTATDIAGVEISANKSNDIAADAASTTKFPTVKSIKDYVDQQSANAGVADNSITSAKINGAIAIAKGGTGATTAAGARTNLGLVIGTDVMSATATTTLTGDVTGSGNGSFATTVNSVGGVSSNTIATLPTSINANTASITANTNNISSLTTSVNANTASITAEITRATNAEAALDTRITSNTASITINANNISSLTTSVNANTASITAEITRATNAEASLDTRITSNTASITTNTADILLKAPINSPTFTGTPSAPTPATSDNSTKVATTEYVKASITAANAGLSSIGAISGTSNANGATISGTTELILTPADATNGGVVTTGSQTFAGAKTFNNDVTATNFLGNATTATTAGNITATSNTTLTSLSNLNTVGTIASGTWSGTAIALANGGTGATTAASARTNLGLVIGTDVMSATATTTLTGDVTGSGNGSFATTLAASGVSSGTYGSSTAIPTFTVDSKGRLTAASTVGIIAGVSNLNYTSATSYVSGGTISGTSLTLAAADANNPGLISTDAQTIGGAKTFSSSVIAPNFLGNVTGTVTGNLSGTATTATNLAGGVLGSIPYQTATGTTSMLPIGTINQVLTTNVSGLPVWQTLIGFNKEVEKVNFGTNTGFGNQANFTTAVGPYAGQQDQGLNATALGRNAGNTGQGYGALAVGALAGGANQGNEAIALGFRAAESGQGERSVAIGMYAGQTNQHANSIILNATGVALNSDRANALYIAPIRTASSSNVLVYNPTTKEVTTTTDIVGNAATSTLSGNITATSNTSLTSLSNLNTVGTITSGTWSGTTIAVANGGTGALTAAAARTNLGLTIGTDVMAANATTTLTGDVTGAGSGTFSTTLSNSGVTTGSYGSSIAIPTFTVDSKGRITAASTVGITAGVSNLDYTSATSYAAGGTISGTALTLAAASATHPGLISTGTQTIAGAKTFSNDVTATNFLGNSTTATTAGNITATSNTTLTSLSNLNTVGTIISGTWSGSAIAIANGGTGATTASAARTNLGLGSLGEKSTIANADVDASAAIAFSKLNITKANITGLGVQEGLTAGSGISINAGTISATGLTTNNLASNAAITNSQLANSVTTLGSTTMTLGGTVTSVAGLSSVTSTGFTGELTGNASTATKLAATKNINGVAFDGSTNITIAADANTLTGTTLASNVVNSSLTSVGTITSGVWSGTTIAIAKGGTGATTKAAAFDALSPMTTAGDIIYGGASGTGARLAAGSNGQVLTMVSGNPAWQNSGGSIATMSASGNATTTASYIIFTGTTASQTITIPSAVTLGAGRELTIKNVASVTVSIASAGGFLIQDNSTMSATSAALGIEPSNNWMKLVSDGTNWYIFRALF